MKMIEKYRGKKVLVLGLGKSGVNAAKLLKKLGAEVTVNDKNTPSDLTQVNELKNEVRTMIFYEAPHKILYTLKDMFEVFGNRNICICRELTKIHEEYLNTNFIDAISQIEENGIKGEIVLIIEGKSEIELEEEKKKELEKLDAVELVKEYINDGIDKKDAIKKVAKELGVNKNEVYKKCIDL